MKPSEPAKTIFKVRATKRTRGYWLMAKILVWFGWSLACFAFVQCGLCKWNHPKRTALECVAPRLAKEGKR